MNMPVCLLTPLGCVSVCMVKMIMGFKFCLTYNSCVWIRTLAAKKIMYREPLIFFYYLCPWLFILVICGHLTFYKACSNHNVVLLNRNTWINVFIHSKLNISFPACYLLPQHYLLQMTVVGYNSNQIGPVIYFKALLERSQLEAVE